MAQRKGPWSNDDGTKVKFNREEFKKAVKIFSYLKPYRYQFFIGLLLLGISSMVFMIFPQASGELLDIATGTSKRGYTLNQVGIGLLIILVVQSFISYTRVMLFNYVSEYSMADIRKALYNKIITLPITFFEKNRIGELTSRTTNDVQQLQDALSLTLAEFIRQIIVLIAGFIILFSQMPKLSLIMFGTFPIIVLAAIYFGKKIRRFSKKRQDQLAESNTIIEETLQSINSVKAFTNEFFEAVRYGNSVGEVVKTSMKFGQMRGAFIAFIIAILFGAMFFVLWQGSIMVQNKEMTPGELVSFIVITAVIGGSIGSIGDFYTQLLKAVGSSERILEMLEMPSEVLLDEAHGPKIQFEGNICYKNVQFSYPTRDDVAVLKGLDLDIKAGTKVALVGTSGGGKSTIVQLLLRYYPLNGGEITVDGTNINEYNITTYRENIALVPQEVILFGGTIKENIGYGKSNASEIEIIEAAKQANAWDFIQSFPDGLDTLVGERGVKLSGGQRQRIAIARAILKDPAILLLDEATSALDAESERVVQDALNKLMEGRTSLVIAHRLATIREVDCIYVIDKGMIVEKGTHEELSSQENGIYNSLAKLQFDANAALA
ncbi:MAG: ABC transporter ATP-binding protein [Saprospiraceae bacterium]